MLNSKLPPRQKMINLMYLIFIAITSISISNKVMQGYGEVYKREIAVNKELASLTNERYVAIMKQIKSDTSLVDTNLDQDVMSIRKQAQEIVATVDYIRESIAKFVDEEKYVENQLQNYNKNTEAIKEVIFNGKESAKLYQQLTDYKKSLSGSLMVGESGNKSIDRCLYYDDNLSYDEWAKGLFDKVSVISAMSTLGRIETGALLCEDMYYVDMYAGVLTDTNENLEEMEQISEKKEELIAELEEEEPRVSTEAMLVTKMDNKLYVGVETQLDLLVNGDDIDNIVVDSNNGTISKKGGAWFVKPVDAAKNTIVKVKRVDGSKEYNLATYTYKVKQLPDPRPIIYYQNRNDKKVTYRGYTSIRKEDLIRDAKIDAELLDLDVNVDFKVVSFEMVCVSKGKANALKNSGNEFNSEQKKAILSMQDSDRLHITSIVVRGSDGIERTISSLDIVLI